MVMSQARRARIDGQDVLMTPAEVAAVFSVSPKTVARWSRSGKLTALRTLGGHRRFRSDEVEALRVESNEIGELAVTNHGEASNN